MPAITCFKNKAFSLIEIMIVISILGVVAAFAIPAYGDYVVRTKVAGMINAVEVTQIGITEYRQANGNFTTGILPNDPTTTFLNIGVSDPTILSPAISQIVFNVFDDYHMAIVVCGDTAGQGTYFADTVDLYFEAIYTISGITWTCAYEGNSKYVPSSCRTLYDPTTYGTQAIACVH